MVIVYLLSSFGICLDTGLCVTNMHSLFSWHFVPNVYVHVCVIFLDIYNALDMCYNVVYEMCATKKLSPLVYLMSLNISLKAMSVT